MIKNFRIKILSLLICLLCSFQSYSQSYVYKHYGVEEGLPSSEVYSAFQDSKGYMWFATDAGVSRFNGYEFENFDASDGLTDNTVFLITEGSNGRIWFGTFNCQLSYYENGKIYPYEYNYKIAEAIKGSSVMVSFKVDTNEIIYMGFSNLGLYKCTKRGFVFQLMPDIKEADYAVKIIKSGGATILGHKKANRNGVLSQLKIQINLFDTGTVSIKIEEKHSLKPVAPNVHCYYKQGVLIRIQGHFFLIESLQSSPKTIPIESPFSDDFTIHSIMNDGTYIWLCSKNKGVYRCIINDNKITIVDHLLDGKSVSRAYQDREKGIWFQTLQEGIYYLSDVEKKHSKTESKITAIEIAL